MISGWAQELDAVFRSVDTIAVLLTIFGLFAAGVVKGATGLGYATCALPFLVMTAGLPTAMALVVAPAVATNVGVALWAGHLRETAVRFSVFYLAIIPGIFLGTRLLTGADPEWACRALGLSILSYVYLALARPAMSLSGGMARLLQGPAGFATGLIAGLTGSQVMPLLPYMMCVGLDPARLVQAINLAVLLSSIILAAALIAAGKVTVPLFVASLATLPFALIGLRLGTRLRAHLSPERFRTIVLVVLLLMGLTLAAR